MKGLIHSKLYETDAGLLASGEQLETFITVRNILNGIVYRTISWI